MIRGAGVVNFKCPTCQGSVTEIYSPTSIYRHDYHHPQTHYEADLPVQCPFCRTAFSVHVKHIAAMTWAAKLVDYPEVPVTFDDKTESTNWLSLNPPDDPFAEWTEAYHRLGDIIAEYGIGGRSERPELAGVINRMVFSGAIAAMEAFLGDTLIKTVISDERVLNRLLLGENELKKKTATLAEINQSPGIVKTKTQEYLASLLYYDLSKIGAIYRVALGVDIFPDSELRTRLHTAVTARHDIVHRNGKTKAGTPLKLSTSNVAALLTDLNDFAYSVVGAIHWAVNRQLETDGF